CRVGSRLAPFTFLESVGKAKRRSGRDLASRLLLGMSLVRPCAYCRLWLAPEMQVCPRGHRAPTLISDQPRRP
ncbi:hypothetical protein ACFW4M_03475, partial [Streptomyces sp. NPDC058794]|uniref:hypothetical protein n=1 Tax=Streptomyces sp. NPDC058794 TaxID=3346636 RepID=UPI0036886B43